MRIFPHRLAQEDDDLKGAIGDFMEENSEIKNYLYKEKGSKIFTLEP